MADEKRKPVLLIVVLVVLAGVSAYLWLTREGDVDSSLASAQFTFVCPECDKEFMVTGEQYREQFVQGGGLVCPACDSKVENTKAAAKDLGSYAPTPEQEEQGRAVKFKKSD